MMFCKIIKFLANVSRGTKPATRAQWAKPRAGFGAAVKIFKAYAAEYFGYRKNGILRPEVGKFQAPH